MKIYPAIDIIGGECVRLVRGEYDKKTVYASDPAETAKRWSDAGAELIHVVDLDGAKAGKPVNFELIVRMAASVTADIEVGGGIRTMTDIENYLSHGVRRVILGTSALGDPELVKEAVHKYSDRIVVGIDAKDGMVAVSGWEEVSDSEAVSFAEKMQSIGVKNIIYTDIATDGMLSGPNVPAMREMADVLDINVVASGGVSSLGDIEALAETGVSGAIVGKALYTGNIDLKKALSIAIQKGIYK